MADLLSCPFCGGEAKYRADHTTERVDTVSCFRCDFHISDDGDVGSCVAAWNRRASPAPVAVPAGYRLVPDAARHAKSLREVAAVLSTERIQGWANPLVALLTDAAEAIAPQPLPENAGQWVLSASPVPSTATQAGAVTEEDFDGDISGIPFVELPQATDRGAAGQIMDAAWPAFGGDNLTAEFWGVFSAAVQFTLRYAALASSPETARDRAERGEAPKYREPDFIGNQPVLCIHGWTDPNNLCPDCENGVGVEGSDTLGDIERAQSSGERANDWRDDPSADERWNAGLDYGQTQLCKLLGVDPDKVSWDAATETLDGDVRAVIGDILTAAYGDNWRSALTGGEE